MATTDEITDAGTRQEYLCRVVDRLLEAHQEWVTSDQTALPVEFVLAVEEVCESFNSGLIPADLRELERRATSLTGAWRLAEKEAGVDGWERGALPGNGFWRALEFLGAERVKLQDQGPSSIETIAQLTEQKVTDAQICKIYGWEDSSGRPQMYKLREERAEPGKHTASWVDPNTLRRLEQLAAQGRKLDELRARGEAKRKRLTEPPPETIPQLIQAGVSAKQIAEMHHITVDEVLRIGKELGQPVQREYAPLTAGRQPNEAQITEEALRSQDQWSRAGKARKPAPAPVESAGDEELPDVDEEAMGEVIDQEAGTATEGGVESNILGYAQAGYDAKSIATMLGKGWNQKRVTEALKKHGAQV